MRRWDTCAVLGQELADSGRDSQFGADGTVVYWICEDDEGAPGRPAIVRLGQAGTNGGAGWRPSTIRIATSRASEGIGPTEGRFRRVGRDKILGIVLVNLALIVTPGLALVLFLEGSLHLIILAAPAVIFLVGLLFLFTDYLETSLGIRDEIEEIPELLEDDVEALFQGRFTLTHFMVAATIVTAIMLSATLVWYKKWEASWGPVNVLVISAAVVAITLIVGIKSRWFQDRRRRIGQRVYLIPLAGLVLSVCLGLYSTEPKEFGGRTRSRGFPSEAARWSATRASEGRFLGLTIGDTLDLVAIDCDGKECLVLLLILIAVVCVVSSAFIPHFWVLAGHLLLTIMALIALRELLVSKGVESA
jgi:hypothetical protein